MDLGLSFTYTYYFVYSRLSSISCDKMQLDFQDRLLVNCYRALCFNISTGSRDFSPDSRSGSFASLSLACQPASTVDKEAELLYSQD